LATIAKYIQIVIIAYSIYYYTLNITKKRRL
jgi:hypothetical protein